MDSRIDASPYFWPHDSTFDPKTTALVIIDMQKDCELMFLFLLLVWIGSLVIVTLSRTPLSGSCSGTCSRFLFQLMMLVCSPEGYLAHQGYDIAPVRAVIPHIQTLLASFRQKGFAIYHTREGHRPDLSTLSSRESARSKNNETGKGIGDIGPLGRLLIRGERGHDIIPELAPFSDENIIDKPGRSAFQHTEFKLMLSIRGIKNLVICGVTTDVCVTSTMRDANDNNFDCLLVEDATAASELELHKGAVEMVKTEGGIFGAVSSTAKILAALRIGTAEKDNNSAEKTTFDTPSEAKDNFS